MYMYRNIKIFMTRIRTCLKRNNIDQDEEYVFFSEFRFTIREFVKPMTVDSNVIRISQATVDRYFW